MSTKLHGIVDYLAVATLLALPRLLSWSDTTTNLLTIVAVMALVYSLLTRYELGLMRVLPVKVHLALDFMAGVLLCSAPLWLARDVSSSEKTGLIILGVFEIGAALMTRTESSQEQATHNIPGQGLPQSR
jgi:short subunit fatty acids transporter